MCCFFTILLFLGPRVAMIFAWLVDQARFNRVFGDAPFLACLGFIFLPWTTLAYLLAWQPVVGIEGFFAWLLIGVAVLVDLGSLFGGGYGNRRQIRGYVWRPPSGN